MVQDMKDNSKTENVSLGTLSPFAKNFRGYVAWSATFLKEILFIADVMSHPEVDEDWSKEVVLFSEHNVI